MTKNINVGVAIGREKNFFSELIFNSLHSSNLNISFLVYVFPTPRRILDYRELKWYIRYSLALLFYLTPVLILKIMLHKYIPKLDVPKFYTKDINSSGVIDFLNSQNPDLLIVYSCGFISSSLCEKFHKKIITAHAGKLPEYRGVNNVEWAYLENKDLYSTIQFTEKYMDTGDIAWENKFEKLPPPCTIKEIRHHAFEKTFSSFSNAIENYLIKGNLPKKQKHSKRTNKYVMHSFIKQVLKKKLNE